MKSGDLLKYRALEQKVRDLDELSSIHNKQNNRDLIWLWAVVGIGAFTNLIHILSHWPGN